MNLWQEAVRRLRLALQPKSMPKRWRVVATYQPPKIIVVESTRYTHSVVEKDSPAAGMQFPFTVIGPENDAAAVAALWSTGYFTGEFWKCFEFTAVEQPMEEA